MGAQPGPRLTDMDAGRYCRAVEASLCRKNGGHLIRIVGAAFEMVRGWAEQGVPLSVVEAGIDRCVERANARGPRRRPLRIEFCEADVLEGYDEWRRAVGPSGDGAERADDASRRRASPPLTGHVDRVVERLEAWTPEDLPDLREVVEAARRDLLTIRTEARRARGPRRRELIAHLSEVEARLAEAARAVAPPAVLAEIEAEVRDDLAGYRGRMPEGELRRAVTAATDRRLYLWARLPRVAFE